VIDSEEDVLDAEPQVGQRPHARGGDRSQSRSRARRTKEMALDPSVRVVDPDENVGNRRLEPRDPQRLSRDSSLALERPSNHHRSRIDLLPVGSQKATSLGDYRGDPDLDLAPRGFLPQELVASIPRFSELEIAGTDLVAPGRGRDRQGGSDESRPSQGTNHRSSPFTKARPSSQPRSHPSSSRERRVVVLRMGSGRLGRTTSIRTPFGGDARTRAASRKRRWRSLRDLRIAGLDDKNLSKTEKVERFRPRLSIGLVSTRTTVLLTPEEMDQAMKKNPKYTPPGK